MKKAAKAFVVSILAWQVRRLRKKHAFTVVAVVGAIGKTSTKFAVANVLSGSKKVRFQAGNYNDIVSVPLIFFGHAMPSLLNPLAWLGVFLKNERQISGSYPYDAVVVELGTDRIGQIAAFKRYLDVDIAVVTAIVPEHMEYFKELSVVAQEELSVASYAKQLLINTDLCAEEYLRDLQNNFISYGIKSQATYKMENISFDESGSSFTLQKNGQKLLEGKHVSFSEQQLYSLTSAAAVSDLLNIPAGEIAQNLSLIKPVSGRMQRLQGVKGSTIIDDSYNASPEAVKAALSTIYRLEAVQRIALLGNMNELGEHSEAAHRDVGSYCDPKKLDLVITLGPDANAYLAETAEKNGCTVIRTDSPYEAGEQILRHLKEGALVLIKGSQNRVYAEEAIKSLLQDPVDRAKLVRQSDSWLKIKAKQFNKSLKEVR